MDPRTHLTSLLGPGQGLTYCRFYDKSEDNYIFANYSLQPLVVDGVTYKTPEHYFQAQKFPAHSTERQQIINCASANDARKIASRLPMTNKTAWDAGGSYQAMLAVVRARLADPAFNAALLATGAAYILEDTYKGPPGGEPADAKWGGGADGMGENLLGMALMEVRNEVFRELDRLHKNIVDPNALRTQARQERRDTELRLGSTNTRGQPLTSIAEQLQQLVRQAKPQPTGRVGLTSEQRVLKALEPYGEVKLSVARDINKPGHFVVKIYFADRVMAGQFAQFAGGAPRGNDGCVIMGPVRAKIVFDKLGVGMHGQTNQHPMFNALIYDSETAKKPVVSAARATPVLGKMEKFSSNPANYALDARGNKRSEEEMAKAQAAAMWRDMVQPLLNAGKKIGLIYSANNDQALDIYQGALNINGAGQAMLFHEIAKMIKNAGVQDKVHILPIATSLHGGDNTVGNNHVALADIHRDLRNVADHRISGWEIRGLATPTGSYAIGGGVSKGWHSTAGVKIIRDADGKIKQITAKDLHFTDTEGVSQGKYVDLALRRIEGMDQAQLLAARASNKPAANAAPARAPTPAVRVPHAEVPEAPPVKKPVHPGGILPGRAIVADPNVLKKLIKEARIGLKNSDNLERRLEQLEKNRNQILKLISDLVAKKEMEKPTPSLLKQAEEYSMTLMSAITNLKKQLAEKGNKQKVKSGPVQPADPVARALPQNGRK